MSADKMPPLPRGYVVVSGYEECGRFADDFPGTRADCSAKFKAGKPCERCPSNSSGAEVLHVYARAYAAEKTRELVEALACEIQRDIMNLPTSPLVEGWAPDERHNYKMGHRDARHDAVEAVLSLIAKHKEQP